MYTKAMKGLQPKMRYFTNERHQGQCYGEMVAPAPYGICCGNLLHSRMNGGQCCLNAAKRMGFTYSKRKQICCNQVVTSSKTVR